MTTTMTPEEQLISADADVKSTKREVADLEETEREAQEQVGNVRGLVAAASRDLKNAEARYRVLVAAAEETKDLRDKKAQIERELGEIARAEKVRDATKGALAPLDDAIQAVTSGEEATRQARDTTRDAKALVDQAAEEVTPASGQAGTSEDTQQGITAGEKAKPPGRGQRRTPANKRNGLGQISAALERDHDQLQQLHREIASSLKDLQAKVGAVQTAATEAADFAKNLEREKTRLEAELADVDAKLKAEPSDAQVRRAKAGRDTANRRFEDAPLAERQAQEALRSARDAREDAQRRYREALDRRDRAERLFITDIDITGPNAGIYTATAVLAEDPPAGYKLRWSSDAGTVNPATGKTVKFDTGKLPPGTYDIEVSLVRP